MSSAFCASSPESLATGGGPERETPTQPTPTRRVDWERILGYARRFDEYGIIQRIRPDADRVHVLVPAARLNRGGDGARERVPRVVESIGPISPGAELADGFRVAAVSLKDGRLRLTAERTAPDGSRHTIPLGAAPAGLYRDATPFDLPGLSVWYEATDVPWATVAKVGKRLGAIVRAAIGDGDAAAAFAAWAGAIAPRRLKTSALDDSERIEIRPDGKMYLRITDSCQERCVFCFFYDTGEIDNLMRHHDLEESLRQIDPSNISQVVLTGGEATLHPRLPDYVRLLAERGFREIILQTNGILLGDPGYLEQLLPYRDLLGIGFSLHAATAATSDAVTTTRKDYFPRKLRGIRRAAELGFRMKVIFVLNGHNLHEVVPALELFHELSRGADIHTQFTFPSFEGRMAHHLDTYPRLEEVARVLPPAFARARELDLRLAMDHQCQVPPCILPHDLQHLESLWFAETPDGMWNAKERAWGPECGECAMRPHCSGVWKEYAEHFGVAGLRPYRADEVPARPKDGTQAGG